MRKLFGILFLSLFCAAVGQAQSLSLPARLPVHCSAQGNDCLFSVSANQTAVVIARFGSSGKITGALGEAWSLDQCVTYTGDCSFHTNFSSFISWCGLCGDKLTFSGNQFSDVFILIYDGLWGFDAGNFGTYNDQNSVFPDCVNGGDCPYPWTLPIETEAGELIISWLDANGYGHIVRPGPGYTYETGDGLVFIEDQIAPVKGVYMGSFTIRQSNGSEGQTHWLAGVAAYKKM